MTVQYFQVYVGQLSLHYEALSVEASKLTTAEEIVSCIVERLKLTVSSYEQLITIFKVVDMNS